MSVKDLDKMSIRELRIEVKTTRESMKLILDQEYKRGYTDGWKACGDKIIKEMEKK